jgi:glycosyltransferase involved in cell wall biosynthesis
MTSPKLISCIVPVFNGEDYIKETLDSIHGQTYRPIQVIVADDGSTDGTADIVERYPHAVVYVRQENSGPAWARNLGLSVATGEFIAFLDADDLWHPQKLERQIACFEACPGLDYCVAHIQNFWISELETEAERFKDHPRSKPVPAYTTHTLLARRSLFEAIGEFDASLHHCDDTEWFLRAGDHGATGELLPEVLAYRRLHRTNRSRIFSHASRQEYLQLIKSRLDQQRALDKKAPPARTAPPDVDRSI